MARRTKREIEVEEAFFGGVSVGLAVMTIHGEGTCWRETLDAACDPRKFRAWAAKEGLLEYCGFVEFDYEYKAILRNDREMHPRKDATHVEPSHN